MPVDLVVLLRRLSVACGVSGYEQAVRALVVGEFSRYADHVRTDALGNVIAVKTGAGAEPRRAVMVATHMDEIGLIVSYLDRGFVRFQQVGGYDDRVLVGQEVMVHGRRDLPGIVGSRPPHVLSKDERDRAIRCDELMIDVGLGAGELGETVRVGDLITLRGDLLELKGGLVSGKALDNRASVAAAVVCLEELSRTQHSWDVYAVATVQEEVGLVGAATSAYGLQPDIAIALDVTWARQPSVPDEYTYELGKGPTVGFGPNFHPAVHKALMEAAGALEITAHLEPAARPPGTDARAIEVTREGIPCGLISIPVRNMHTPVETVAMKDIERAGRLLAAFVERLDDGFMSGLAWDLGLDV